MADTGPVQHSAAIAPILDDLTPSTVDGSWEPLRNKNGLVPRAWFHRLALATRAVTLHTFTVSSTCVASTRIATNIIAEANINHRVLPVFVGAFNADGLQLFIDRVPVDQWPTTAHSVGVDEGSLHKFGTRTGRWNGHLVFTVSQPGMSRLLIDVTADQFARPGRGIIIGGPVFMDINPDTLFTPRDPQFTATAGTPDNTETFLGYRPMPPGHPETNRWKQSPDWVRTDADLDPMTDAVKRLMADQRFGTGASVVAS